MLLRSILGLFRRKDQLVYCWRCDKYVRGLSESENKWFVYELERFKVRSSVISKRQRDSGRSEYSASELQALRKIGDRFDRVSRRLGGPASSRCFLTKHRLSYIGPPCIGCGKNLRTTKSNWCLECGRQPASPDFAEAISFS